MSSARDIPRVLAIQHIACETLGTIADVLSAGGVSAEYVRTFDGQSAPKSLKDFSGLIVMGGPMGVYEQDRYPFLRDEIRLINEALRDEKPVLGVCLGSQLLASALGAEVTKGPLKEIGWFPVTLTPDAKGDPLWRGLDPSFVAYHWHGDVFELPPGAVALASSALTRYQAFRYGLCAYGVLFHLEVTDRIIEEMVGTFEDELRQTGLDGRAIIEQASEHLPRLRRIGGALFEKWVVLVNAFHAGKGRG